MKDKVVVITGSTSGIGLGIAKKFAGSGAKLVINGFAGGIEIDREIKALEVAGASDVLYDGADLTKPDEIENMFAGILDSYGKVDVLINNAGIQHVAPIDEFPPEMWEKIIRLDLISAFYTMRAALPSMKKNKWGRIINIASAHAIVASPYKSAYIAAKHGMLGMTKSVALEVAEQGITVNAICPGYVKTPLVLGQVADTAKARHISEEEVVRDVLLAAQATKQFVEIEEVAALAFFLSSDSAKSITGSAQIIDGGWTAH